MKKIALMTWHHAENYGTAYQAYALKNLIEDLGFIVDLVSYKRKGAAQQNYSLAKYIYFFSKNIYHRFIKRSQKNFKFKNSTFNSFYKENFSYTIPCEFNQDFEKLNSLYDGFVCGSDQIWGPEWFDARYFLDFVHNKNRLIAYAPSIGVTSLQCNNQISNEIQTLVNRFSHISIREQSGCSIIKDLTKRNDIFNALDPVLLARKEIWDKLETPIDNKKYEKLCLIFFLVNNNKNISASIKYAKSKGLTPIILHCTQSEDTKYANVNELTPGELIYYMKRVQYICTDSFHIMVLSIVFGKQFTIFKKSSDEALYSKNSRIIDLLSQLGIQDVLENFAYEIDYSNVEIKLESLREESIKFLRESLNSIPDRRDESIINICWSKNKCKGVQCSRFRNRKNSLKGITRIIYLIMEKAPYTLENKCYRCASLSGYNLSDNRKPLFYEDLVQRISNNENVFKIFSKYYIVYYLKILIKNSYEILFRR